MFITATESKLRWPPPLPPLSPGTAPYLDNGNCLLNLSFDFHSYSLMNDFSEQKRFSQKIPAVPVNFPTPFHQWFCDVCRLLLTPHHANAEHYRVMITSSFPCLTTPNCRAPGHSRTFSTCFSSVFTFLFSVALSAHDDLPLRLHALFLCLSGCTSEIPEHPF